MGPRISWLGAGAGSRPGLRRTSQDVDTAVGPGRLYAMVQGEFKATVFGGAAAASCCTGGRGWVVAILINYSGPPRAPTLRKSCQSGPPNGHV
jgi:hypothetical protein